MVFEFPSIFFPTQDLLLEVFDYLVYSYFHMRILQHDNIY